MINMKRCIKITVILVLIGLGLMQCNKVYAVPKDDRYINGGGYADGGEGKVIDEIGTAYPDVYKPSLSNEKLEIEAFDKKVKAILSTIRAIGIILSIGVLMIIGIKTMIAGVEEKTILKKAMPGYVLGVILVVAITALPSLIFEIVKSVK